MTRPRASVRARLTALYALLFLACGSALIGLNEHAALDELFEPFRRRPGDGAGPGLGLAIARSVALRHGGRLEASVREQGGLAVRLTLPAAEVRAAAGEREGVH